jgi:hypothetical protein
VRRVAGFVRAMSGVGRSNADHAGRKVIHSPLSVDPLHSFRLAGEELESIESKSREGKTLVGQF